MDAGNTQITDVLREAEISFHVTASRLPAEWERSVTILCATGWTVKCLFITNGMGRFNGMSESGEALEAGKSSHERHERHGSLMSLVGHGMSESGEA